MPSTSSPLPRDDHPDCGRFLVRSAQAPDLPRTQASRSARLEGRGGLMLRDARALKVSFCCSGLPARAPQHDAGRGFSCVESSGIRWSEPRMELIIRNARVRGQQEPLEIAIENGRISAVGTSPEPTAGQEIDAAGSLVLPGFINLHLHADKSLLGEVMRPNLSGTLP